MTEFTGLDIEMEIKESYTEVRLTFAEAQRLLREEGPPEFANVRDDEDMSTPQEKALSEVVRSKFGTNFYVVDKFPETARPFYAKIDDTTTGNGVQVTNSFDFFARNQEILSGGQRINNAVTSRLEFARRASTRTALPV